MQCIAAVAVIGVAGLAPTAVEAQTGPDLNPYALVVTTNPGGTRPGGNVGPSVGVRNDGDESSAATTVRFYQSTDATITTADTEVGTNTLGALSPGATASIGATVSAPSTPGTYYYGACVDAVAGESDTTNNCSTSVQVTVSEPLAGPDLTVGSPSVNNTSPTTEGAFILSATVSNAGDGAAAATTLRYYRSTDATITTSDTSVGTDAVGGLAAEATSSESIDLTAPSTAGTYYYGACVEAVAGESDTTNNCSTSVQVTVSGVKPKPPDVARDERVAEDRARGEDMVGEAARVGVLFADAPPGLVHQEPVEDVGRFVDGGRDGLGGERGESVGDVRVRLDAGFGPVPGVGQVEGFAPAAGREELASLGPRGMAASFAKTFKLSTDPFFIEKVRDIVGLYLDPPDHAMGAVRG